MGNTARKQIPESDIQALALDKASEGIAVLRNEIYIYMNRAHAAHYGYASPEELIGKSWRGLYSPRELNRFQQDIIPKLYKKREVQIEAIGRKKDGSPFPQEVSLYLLDDETMVCVVNDISSRKQAQLDLMQSKRFLRKVIDTDPNFIFVKDREGRFLLANLAVANAYGTTVTDIVGKSDGDFNPSADEVEHFRQDDLFVIDNLAEKIIPEEKITDASGTERWLSTVKRPLIFSPEGPAHILGVSMDITEARKLHEDLFQASKMEALGQLAGGIAHDFNNLLTAITGAAEFIRLSTEPGTDPYRYSVLVEKASSSAKVLTQKLLGFARKGKHQHTCIDINQSIVNTLVLLGRTFDKGIRLVEKLDPAGPRMLGDPVQLEQIILNLAINARDAMAWPASEERKKEITFETRVVASPVPQLPPGDYVEVIIRDTGCGIDPAHLSRIFEPFFTTKESGQGTGLGLSMVYGIVKNHGGTVLVESELGKGSAFKIYLPRADAESGVRPAEPKKKRAVMSGHVMVIDDQPEVREVTAGLLRKVGYTVSTASSGREALSIAASNDIAIDVAVVDLIMPEMGGAECISRLKAVRPGLKLILATGYGQNNAAQGILDNGISGFIQKPYNVDQLVDVISSALNEAGA